MVKITMQPKKKVPLKTLPKKLNNTFRNIGIFSSGDVVHGPRTVVEAVAHSKVVAETMHQYMQSLKD